MSLLLLLIPCSCSGSLVVSTFRGRFGRERGEPPFKSAAIFLSTSSSNISVPLSFSSGFSKSVSAKTNAEADAPSTEVDPKLGMSGLIGDETIGLGGGGGTHC